MLPLLLLLTACGAPASPGTSPPPTVPAPPAVSPAVDGARRGASPFPGVSATPVPGCVRRPARRLELTLIRMEAFDYDPLNSPEELAAKAPLVVAGITEDFMPGPVVEEGLPGDRAHHVLLPVRVTERFKGRISGGLVHVKFSQGARGSDGLPRESVADFRRAVPAGNRVLLFLYPQIRSPDPSRAWPTIKDRARLPAGTVLYETHPQGILFEQGLKVVGGTEDVNPASRWADPCGLAGIAERLRRAGYRGSS
ncbi:hypothetical protein ACLQ2R_08760 [Streptosporangium sp. DT93]|uniref:hypothetical protein n=1 Tax=Streptosporangium sp. DT93 TaxID=3393428 RepID=UPI003CF8534E